MKNKTTAYGLRICAAFVLLAGSMAANGEVIYSNGGPLDGGSTAASDLDSLFTPDITLQECVDFDLPCFNEAADNFTLSSAATVNGVNWWGVYTPDNQFNAVPDDFSIRILDDTFALVADINVGAVSRFDTGLDAALLTEPRDIFGYEATFASIDLAAGDYYLSIVNNTAGDALSQRWSWQATAGVTGDAGLFRQSTTPFVDSNSGWMSTGDPPDVPGIDFAFEITAVPEPSTIALLGLGLAGIGFARRRKNR